MLDNQGSHELSRDATWWWERNEVQETIQAEHQKDPSCQVSGNCGRGFHNGSPLLTIITIDANYLDANTTDGISSWRIQVIYGPRRSKGGPRLARHDQSDARAYPLCSS